MLLYLKKKAVPVGAIIWCWSVCALFPWHMRVKAWYVSVFLARSVWQLKELSEQLDLRCLVSLCVGW